MENQLSLAGLLLPHSTQSFFSEVWERRPLFIHRRDAHFYAKLLAASEIEALIENVWKARPDAVELIDPDLGAKTRRRPGSLTDASRAYARGSTIRCRNIQLYRPPILALCRDLEERFSAQTGANLYCTPPKSRGLRRHFDRHDTIVLQIAGAKRWLTFPPIHELPLQYTAPLSFESSAQIEERIRLREIEDAQLASSVTAPAQEFALEEGDLLYLPRGYVHQAATQEPASVHITIGVYVFTWHDALVTAIASLSDRHPELRKALPAGFFARAAWSEDEHRVSAIVRGLAQQGDLPAALNAIADRFAAANGTLALNLGPGRVDEMNGDSVIRRNPEASIQFLRQDGRVGLRWGHKILWAPLGAEQALKKLSETRALKVREIGCGLSEDAMLTLAKRLVREGAFALES